MTFKVGSITSKPAIMAAAARVFPAPNTPLMGQSVLENCAKRWQTREGTYQLKRRRLPDVRDLPEYPGTDIDMEDI